MSNDQAKLVLERYGSNLKGPLAIVYANSGAVIALKQLFGLPIMDGVLVMRLDGLLVLFVGAYHLLWQQLGKGGASVFAIGLIGLSFSGQYSAITESWMVRQVVMEEFLVDDTLVALDGVESFWYHPSPSPRLVRQTAARPTFTARMFKRNLWARRRIARGLAIIPALVVTTTQGDAGIDDLLVLSHRVRCIVAICGLASVCYVEGNGSRYSVNESTIHEIVDDGAAGANRRGLRLFMPTRDHWL
ncbi:UNVERIFIED_CONTAM: hypothetical protein HDU68_010059 [Siphonaria sp. JEL0065]|nr:hypothetical protein HDU68_010059 [Siphonaria sp. JEL0065]